MEVLFALMNKQQEQDSGQKQDRELICYLPCQVMTTLWPTGNNIPSTFLRAFSSCKITPFCGMMKATRLKTQLLKNTSHTPQKSLRNMPPFWSTIRISLLLVG